MFHSTKNLSTSFLKDVPSSNLLTPHILSQEIIITNLSEVSIGSNSLNPAIRSLAFVFAPVRLWTSTTLKNATFLLLSFPHIARLKRYLQHQIAIYNKTTTLGSRPETFRKREFESLNLLQKYLSQTKDVSAANKKMDLLYNLKDFDYTPSISATPLSPQTGNRNIDRIWQMLEQIEEWKLDLKFQLWLSQFVINNGWTFFKNMAALIELQADCKNIGYVNQVKRKYMIKTAVEKHLSPLYQCKGIELASYYEPLLQQSLDFLYASNEDTITHPQIMPTTAFEIISKLGSDDLDHWCAMFWQCLGLLEGSC